MSVGECAYVRVCVSECARARARVCVCVCVSLCCVIIGLLINVFL